MPRSTISGPTDLAMLAACHRWAELLGARPEEGSRCADGFFVLIAADGHPTDLAIGGTSRLRDAADQRPQGASYVLYDPFEGPEHTWIEWSHVPPAFFEVLRRALATAADPLEKQGPPEAWPPPSSGACMG